MGLVLAHIDCCVIHEALDSCSVTKGRFLLYPVLMLRLLLLIALIALIARLFFCVFLLADRVLALFLALLAHDERARCLCGGHSLRRAVS